MILAMIHISREVAGQPVPLLGKRIIVVLWTGRCRRVDGDKPLPWNGLGNDPGA